MGARWGRAWVVLSLLRRGRPRRRRRTASLRFRTPAPTAISPSPAPAVPMTHFRALTAALALALAPWLRTRHRRYSCHNSTNNRRRSIPRIRAHHQHLRHHHHSNDKGITSPRRAWRSRRSCTRPCPCPCTSLNRRDMHGSRHRPTRIRTRMRVSTCCRLCSIRTRTRSLSL